MSTSVTAFLLTVSSRDLNGRFEISLHAATENGKPLVVTIDTFRPLFFVLRSTPPDLTQACVERKSLPLRTLGGEEVDCLYFRTLAQARDTALWLRGQNVRVFESDINAAWRYLMERGVKGGLECEGDTRERGGTVFMYNPKVRGAAVEPSLRVMAIDIETNVASGEIYSIACSGAAEMVFVRAQLEPRPALCPCKDEREMLAAFLAYVQKQDPDIILGWSVIDFDLRVLDERCRAFGLPFTLGRGAVARVTPNQRPGPKFNVRIPGRAVLDGPMMLRQYNYQFEEYSLDFVSSQMLGKQKLIGEHGAAKIAEIDRRFREDPMALARYNLMDARLTKQVFEKSGIIANAIERSRLCGHLLDRTGGSVAAFEYLYLPPLHRAGRVANDLLDVAPASRPLSGGYVMEPKAGVFRNVAVLDFRSLYPSIMMTFLVDPLGLADPSEPRVRTPARTSFARSAAILPGIIRELMEARANARQTGNQSLSQAIKIIMNSFYGVLGTPNCRFFAEALAQTITETGQFVFKKTAAYIEQSTGFKVIYGDTDSMFVLMGEGHDIDGAEQGQKIAESVTVWLDKEIRREFETDSALVLQFEKHFLHFLIPSVRGGGEGSKKHYCGAVRGGQGLELTFKGMESARSDWTDIAKEFQHELCVRLFEERAPEEYITQVVAAVRKGECDSKLVIKKRMRKEADQYVDNVPQHVQAARLMDTPDSHVRYVITTQGPQPVEKKSAPLDYDYYVDTQLRPIADTLLEFSGLNFERIVSGQQSLF